MDVHFVRRSRAAMRTLSPFLVAIGLAACGSSSGGPTGSGPPPAPAPPPAPPPAAAPSFVGDYDGSATRTEHASSQTYSNESSTVEITYNESTGLVRVVVVAGGHGMTVPECSPAEESSLECTYQSGDSRTRLSLSFTGDRATGGYMLDVDQYDGTYVLSRTVQGTWDR